MARQANDGIVAKQAGRGRLWGFVGHVAGFWGCTCGQPGVKLWARGANLRGARPARSSLASGVRD